MADRPFSSPGEKVTQEEWDRIFGVKVRHPCMECGVWSPSMSKELPEGWAAMGNGQVMCPYCVRKHHG